jgi:hypothetical protein
MKPTIETIKTMVNESHLINAAKTVFTAIAYEQTVAEIIKTKQMEVISFFKFKSAPEWQEKLKNKKVLPELITRPEDMYLASDEDFNLYLNEMHKFHKESGFKVKKNYCPLLVAESLTREAKRAFVDLLEPFTGISFDGLICSGLKNYHKYIDLNLSLFAGKVKIN